MCHLDIQWDQMFLQDNMHLAGKHPQFQWSFDWVLACSHPTCKKILDHSFLIGCLEMMKFQNLHSICLEDKKGTRLPLPVSAARMQMALVAIMHAYLSNASRIWANVFCFLTLYTHSKLMDGPPINCGKLFQNVNVTSKRSFLGILHLKYEKIWNAPITTLTTNYITFQGTNHNTDQSITTFIWISNCHLTLKMTSAQNVENQSLPTVLLKTPFTQTIKSHWGM